MKERKKEGQFYPIRVIKSFFTTMELSREINKFLYLYFMMILTNKKGTICKLVASITKAHRAVDPKTLDEKMQTHTSTPPIHQAQQFSKQPLDFYSNQLIGMSM
jgi:hypothetical protein